MSDWIVRPSAILKLDECAQAYEYQYEMRIRSWATGVNLPFGTAVHEGCTEYIRYQALGKSFDPVRAFEASFQEALEQNVIQFPSDKTPEEYLDMGRRMTERFPDAWDKSRLQVVVDPQGDPVVERKFRVRVAPGIILSGTTDILAMDEEGNVGVTDIKTPASASPPFFARVSEQLTSYQMMCDDEVNRDALGIDGVDWVGFLEGIKRKVPKTSKGQGPTWNPLVRSKRHSRDQVMDLKKKIIHYHRMRQNGYFPKTPKMAYNTPCAMCEYQAYCHNGSTRGLIFPEKTTQDQPAQELPLVSAF